MLCVCTKRVCVRFTVLVCKAVQLAFSCQTSSILFPFIPIPWFWLFNRCLSFQSSILGAGNFFFWIHNTHNSEHSNSISTAGYFDLMIYARSFRFRYSWWLRFQLDNVYHVNNEQSCRLSKDRYQAFISISTIPEFLPQIRLHSSDSFLKL